MTRTQCCREAGYCAIVAKGRYAVPTLERRVTTSARAFLSRVGRLVLATPECWPAFYCYGKTAVGGGWLKATGSPPITAETFVSTSG